MSDEAVQACPPSALYRFCKFVRRNKSPVLAATLLVLALLGGIVGTTWGMLRARDAEGLAWNETQQKEQALEEKNAALQTAQDNYRQARKQETLAKDHAKTAEVQELLARRRFYAAQMNLAMQAWEVGDAARTLELLETQRPRFDQDDLRGFEWYYLWRMCHRALRTLLKGHQGTVYSIAFHPDGNTLASTGAGAIRLYDVATAKEKRSWQSRAWALTISLDGKTLGSWGERDPVRLWDAVSGKQLATFSGADSCTFSPDGKAVAVTRGADVDFWDAAGRRRQSVLHVNQRGAHPRSGDTFLFAPDGKTALARVTANLLRIYRRGGGGWQEGGEISGHGWQLPTDVSADGKTFAVGGNVLKLYAADTGKELRTLAGHTGGVYSVAFSPDGKSLASGGGDRTVRVWDVATGKQRTTSPSTFD